MDNSEAMKSWDGHMLDITAPKRGVEVEVDDKRGVLYVHVDGMTVLRICRMPSAVSVVLNGEVSN